MVELTDLNTLKGFVDYADSRVIRGWAFDKANPDKNLSIDIRINGQIVGSAHCYGHRPDLLKAGMGNGNYQFEFSPILFLKNETAEYSIEFGGTGRVLDNGKGSISPNVNLYNVFVGKDDYIFLGKVDGRDLIGQITGRENLSDQQKQMYRTAFLTRHAVARHIGAEYMFCVVPEKMVVCQSMLPPSIKPSSSRIVFEVLAAYNEMTGRSGFYLGGPEDPVTQQQWSLKSDSHLSPRGYLAYFSGLMGHIVRTGGKSPSLQHTGKAGELERLVRSLRLPDKWVDFTGFSGDLATISPFPNAKEVYTEARYSEPKARIIDMGGLKQGRFVESKCDSACPLRVLLIGTSSAETMLPMFQENFSYVYYRHDFVMDYSLMHQTKPDIVVHLVTERTLHTLPMDVLLKR